MNRNGMKRNVLTASLFALVAMCVVLLTACGGPSDSDIIRTKMSEDLDKVKNLDDDMINDMIKASGTSLEKYGIDPKEFAKSFFDKFDYKINSIDVNGNKATAHVTVTCKSAKDIMSKLQDEMAMLIMSGSLKPGTDEFNSQVKDLLEKSVEETDTKDTDCDFGFTRKTDEWSADATQSDELSKALGEQ